MAADAELRRRHPDQLWSPLRSAEPDPATMAIKDNLVSFRPGSIEETRQRINDLSAAHHQFIEKLAERQSVLTLAEDPDLEHLGQVLASRTPPTRNAILQPPTPTIPPSEQIMEHLKKRGADREIG